MQRFHYDVHLYRVLFGNSRAVNLKNEFMRKILLAALAAVLTVSAHGQNKKITISDTSMMIRPEKRLSAQE